MGGGDRGVFPGQPSGGLAIFLISSFLGVSFTDVVRPGQACSCTFAGQKLASGPPPLLPTFGWGEADCWGALGHPMYWWSHGAKGTESGPQGQGCLQLSPTARSCQPPAQTVPDGEAGQADVPGNCHLPGLPLFWLNTPPRDAPYPLPCALSTCLFPGGSQKSGPVHVVRTAEASEQRVQLQSKPRAQAPSSHPSI